MIVKTFYIFFFFFFNDTATTEIYTLSLHDALPIGRPPSPCRSLAVGPPPLGARGPALGPEEDCTPGMICGPVARNGCQRPGPHALHGPHGRLYTWLPHTSTRCYP